MTGKKPTRAEVLIGGRMKAIDRNRARAGQARQRVEAAIREMQRSGRQLTNAAIHTLADVHENWLYEHADVNRKLTLERDTAVIEARRLKRDLSATQAALASAERRNVPSC